MPYICDVEEGLRLVLRRPRHLLGATYFGDTYHGYTHYGALSSAALATSSGSAELAPAPKSSSERKASTVRGEAHTCE